MTEYKALIAGATRGLQKTVVKGLRAAADIILPRTCAVCGRRLNLDERHLCLPCLAEIPLTHFWERNHNIMADRLNQLIESGIDSYLTEGRLERYAFAAALFFYDGQGCFRHIPHRLKYQGDISIGKFFGQMLGRKLAGANHFKDVDLVIPVPLHWTRRWKRGYNQAEVIAQEIADGLGCFMRTDILKRRRRTRTQTKVDPKDKSANVSGAFIARLPQDKTEKFSIDPVCMRKHPNDVYMRGKFHVNNNYGYRHILLVDDVFTSGSTLHSCFLALRAVFPVEVRISIATLGFVGGA